MYTFERDLRDMNYPLPKFRERQDWFAARGVQVNYSARKRSWFFMAYGRGSGGPTTVICWCGPGALVDMLESPKDTLKAIAEKGGDVAKRRTGECDCCGRQKPLSGFTLAIVAGIETAACAACQETLDD